MEFMPTAKNFQETEEDSTSFGNSTGETEWEQYPFYPAIDNIVESEEASLENSICAHDGSFSEKDDDFVFDFTEEVIEVCYYRKGRYISGRRKMKGAKASAKKKRNVLLEAWGCIRKLFLKFLECKSSLEILKNFFNENSELWENQFRIYRRFFMKAANKIPRNKFSLGFLDAENSGDPYVYTINRVLRVLFTSFINEKAEIYINRLEMISGIMKEILIEMIILYKKTLNKNKY